MHTGIHRRNGLWSSRVLGLSLCALTLTPNRAWAAPETVRLDMAGPAFDRQLPSSSDFVLEVAAPGKEAARGRLEIWPMAEEHDNDGNCNATAPGDAKQHYQLAMLPTGSDEDRVLRATVPAFQVRTRYCFNVSVRRGLDAANAALVADAVAIDLALTSDLAILCQASSHEGQRDALARKLSLSIQRAAPGTTRNALTELGQVGAYVQPDQRDSVAQTIAATVPLPVLCRAVDDAREQHARAISQYDADKTALQQANGHLFLPAGDTAFAKFPIEVRLPLFMVKSGAADSILTVDQVDVDNADQVQAALAVLGVVDPAAGQLLSDWRDADQAERPAKRQAYINALKNRKKTSALIHYYAGATQNSIPATDLFLAAGDHRTIVLENLERVRKQLELSRVESKNAQFWLDRVVALESASKAEKAARDVVDARRQAAETARAAIPAAVKARILDADIRDMLTTVVSVRISRTSVESPATEAGASMVSPELGVIVGFPLYREGASWEPWLLPYAAVNIYFRGVDRVIALEQLVGSRKERFLQRFALTLGALITRPEVHGAKISMAFLDSGLVPMLGVGYRVTSFTRVTAGAFMFDYRDQNPAVGDLHHSAALWLGASIDADVWALAAGKAFN